MAQAYYATRLSARLSETPHGFLICKDAVLCRTGTQEYQGHEVGIGTAKVVRVLRPKSEVFDKRFLASLEGSVVTDGHPSGFVTSDTAAWSVKGHVQNIRQGGELPSGDLAVIGDIFITDETLKQKIRSGQARELSVGYDVQYLRNADGSLTQTNLVANHVAVVPSARGGSDVRIYDSPRRPQESFAAMAARYHRRDPAKVAAEILAARATDRLPESLLRGEPHSWDELSEIHANLTSGEDQMAKNKTAADELMTEEEREVVERVLARLESHVVEGESTYDEKETPESRALDHLRSIRPLVERSGDREAIDAYNNAIRAIKRQMLDDRVLGVDVRTPAQRVADAELERRRNFTSFGEIARLFHRRSMREGQAAYEEMSRKMGAGFRRMDDSKKQESFAEICARRRRELLDGKK